MISDAPFCVKKERLGRGDGASETLPSGILVAVGDRLRRIAACARFEDGASRACAPSALAGGKRRGPGRLGNVSRTASKREVAPADDS